MRMYSRKLIDETIHVTTNETADDVKIYIRHNTGEIVKDFYEQYKADAQQNIRKLCEEQDFS
ncbi:MAG: hypothetical protein JJE49_03160 [Peptostreptococcaceae bacterium]|nr:hypothetical protein [Peptostreptococcaceae bacterium]